MPHPPRHPTTDAHQPETLNQATDEGELSLYRLQGMLHSIAMDLKPAMSSAKVDVAEALRYLESKDPARARTVRRCLLLASDIVNEAAAQLNSGIDWGTVEALYCPLEEFQDTPEHWFVIGSAAAQKMQNGHAPADPIVFAPAATNREAPEQEPAAAPLPKAPNRAALQSLGRSLRSDNEKEKRRFYAVARDTGLPTGENAQGAMFEALSKLFGETLTSHSQLDEIRWSKATSALYTRDLFWFAPPKLRGPRRSGPKP